MTEILRYPTKEELSGNPNDETSPAFVPIAVPGGRVKSVKERFNERINIEEQKAMTKGLPFATWAVRNDIKDLSDEFNKKFRRQGYLKDFKIPTLDEIEWDKYSDLKNWEVIKEDMVRDPQFSKEHKVSVYRKRKYYKYKGYSNICIVMEDTHEALTRALDSLENRKVRREK